jgi:DNA helicase II / ATP-dependent DNA helicase PcrA
MNTTLLESLNPEQRAAVLSTEGPSLILAGAGSGKTKTLTHRIAYLIAQGIPAYNILAVTFTNKAANEMKKRILNLLGTEEEQSNAFFSFGTKHVPTMGTFHSICARILRRDIEAIGREKSFVIYDTEDQKNVVKEIVKSLHIDEKELKPKVALSYISRCKCEGLSPKDARAQATTSMMQQVMTVYEKYQDALKTSNALDFDDLLLETVRLFTTAPEVLEKYQDLWRYIHVDEYQDTNHIQYTLVSLLAKKYRNICVIGDPDQSIYAFRGADIRNILEFNKEYPDAHSTKLEQNYRSTQTVLDAATAVISTNPNRPEKTMWTNNGQGEKVLIHELHDEKREAREAIEHIKRHRDNGVPLHEQVVLYRMNAQSRLLEEACMRASIPYRIVGGVKFYQRLEVKDVLAYINVILNPQNEVALLRIINVPSRKLGQTSIGRLQAYATSQSMSLWDAMKSVLFVPEINEPTKARISEFVENIEKIMTAKHTHSVYDLATKILHTFQLEAWYNDNTVEGQERWQNIQELLTVMQKYDGLDPEISLTSFLEEVALVSEVDALPENSDALTLMTLHLCKGLEFDHVVIVGCEEGIFPGSQSIINKDELEEECRLMYVGMTRAKKYLALLHASSRALWGEAQNNAPSRFLEDIPEHLIERRTDDTLSAFAWATERAQQKIWSNHPVAPYRQHSHNEFNQEVEYSDEERVFDVGTVVEHPTFGRGTILALRGDIAEIRFSVGTKNLALSIAPLKIIS